MSFEPRDYLRHILVEADYLVVRSAGVTFDEFAANDTLRRAFVRSLEIIGEAAKKIPDEFRAQHPGSSQDSVPQSLDRPESDRSRHECRHDELRGYENTGATWGEGRGSQDRHGAMICRIASRTILNWPR